MSKRRIAPTISTVTASMSEALCHGHTQSIKAVTWVELLGR